MSYILKCPIYVQLNNLHLPLSLYIYIYTYVYIYIYIYIHNIYIYLSLSLYIYIYLIHTCIYVLNNLHLFIITSIITISSITIIIIIIIIIIIMLFYLLNNSFTSLYLAKPVDNLHLPPEQFMYIDHWKHRYSELRICRRGNMCFWHDFKICPHTLRRTFLLLTQLFAKRRYFGRAPCIRNAL